MFAFFTFIARMPVVVATVKYDMLSIVSYLIEEYRFFFVADRAIQSDFVIIFVHRVISFRLILPLLPIIHGL